MDLLIFIFRIGVVLAVYNFLWWLFMIGIKILRGNGEKQVFEVYFIKAVRYLFLVDVIFLFTIEQSGGVLAFNDYLLAGLIMLVYFVGKIQKKQVRNSFFNIRTSTGIGEMNNLFNRIKPIFDLRLEILVVVLAMGLFSVFYFFTEIAYNPIANWLVENIIGIEEAPVFGFIFKVIGFFFLVSVLMKLMQGVMTLLTGGRANKYPNNKRDDDGFDDYTEIE